MKDDRKIIDGGLANYLADAAGSFGRLECELTDLQWRICFRKGLSTDTSKVRQHCRDLLHAMKGVEHCLRFYSNESDDEDEADVNVIKIEAKVPRKGD